MATSPRSAPGLGPGAAIKVWAGTSPSDLTLAEKEQARQEDLYKLYVTTGKTIKIIFLIVAIILTLLALLLL